MSRKPDDLNREPQWSKPGKAYRDACVRDSFRLGLLGKRLVLDAVEACGETDSMPPTVVMPVRTFLSLSREPETDVYLPEDQDDLRGWVRSVAESLVRRCVSTPVGDTDIVWPWFTAVRYQKGKESVEVMLCDSAVEFLRWAKTSPEYLAFLRQARNGLENPYAQRLYAILRIEVSQERPRAHIRMPAEAFRRIFLLTEKYLGNFGPLKQSVIKPAMQEINTKQDIRIGYSSLNGPHNRTEAIEFHVELKSAVRNPFDD